MNVCGTGSASPRYSWMSWPSSSNGTRKSYWPEPWSHCKRPHMPTRRSWSTTETVRTRRRSVQISGRRLVPAEDLIGNCHIFRDISHIMRWHFFNFGNYATIPLGSVYIPFISYLLPAMTAGMVLFSLYWVIMAKWDVVLETSNIARSTTAALLSTLTGTFISVDRFCPHHRVKTLQYAVTKLYRCVSEIKTKTSVVQPRVLLMCIQLVFTFPFKECLWMLYLPWGTFEAPHSVIWPPACVQYICWRGGLLHTAAWQHCSL